MREFPRTNAEIEKISLRNFFPPSLAFVWKSTTRGFAVNLFLRSEIVIYECVKSKAICAIRAGTAVARVCVVEPCASDA